MDPAIRHATQAPEHDPVPLLSFMGAVTTRIGLGATFSISHQHPFYAARLWATLDHLTCGRAAWNVVTSLNHNQAANHGEERKPTDERYDRAHEFIEVCKKLWDSWEPDALVMDRAAGVFADPAKVHRIEHVGDYFKSRGPLNVVRSPQNGPAILQAGTSPKGRTFAARYADAIFAIQPNLAGAKAYYDDIKRATVSEGRKPDACKVLFGIQPILGRTEAEAREKQEEHNSLVPLEGGLAILSGHLDFDLSALPLDELMANRTEPPLQRMHARYRSLTGAANIIVTKPPNAKDVIDKLLPFQGLIGVILLLWGVVGVFDVLRTVRWMHLAPFWFLVFVATVVTELGLGFLLAYGLITKF